MTAEDPAQAPPGGALGPLPLAELRARRLELRTEAARVQRWDRLLQARMDLAADAAAPVEGLRDAAVSTSLRTVVDAGSAPALAAEDLRQVAGLRRELHGYRQRVLRQLSAATDELLARYAADPARCLIGR